MDKILDLFAQSTIVQATVTLLLVGAIVYQILTINQANETLVNFASLVIGFWFGGKSAQTLVSLSNKAKDTNE